MDPDQRTTWDEALTRLDSALDRIETDLAAGVDQTTAIPGPEAFPWDGATPDAATMARLARVISRMETLGGQVTAIRDRDEAALRARTMAPGRITGVGRTLSSVV